MCFSGHEDLHHPALLLHKNIRIQSHDNLLIVPLMALPKNPLSLIVAQYTNLSTHSPSQAYAFPILVPASEG